MVHLYKKTNQILGWIPPWQRADPDTTQCSNVDREEQRRQQTAYNKHDQQNKSALDYDSVHYYNNDKDGLILSSSPMHIEMNSGNASPPLSPTSHSRRSTIGPILDLFHRRKSNASSVMSLQHSSSLGSVSPTGRKPAYSAIVSHSPPYYEPTTMTDSAARPPQPINNTNIHDNLSYRNSSPPSSYASPPSSSCSNTDNTFSSIGLGDVTTLPPASLSTHQQHHRFPFIHSHHHHHPTETTNNNHQFGNMTRSTISHPRTMATPEEQSQNHPSSILASAHNAPLSSTNRPRIYEVLLKHGSPFSEHTVGMEANLPPTTDDTKKRITLSHGLMKLALDGLFKSPLGADQDSERQILQIGCGDGSWSIDCAKKSPQWFVLGLDNKDGGDLISAGVTKKAMLPGAASAPAPAKQQPTSTLSSSSSSTSSSLSSSSGGHGNNFLFMKSTHSLVESLKWLPDGCFDLVYGRFLALALPTNDYEVLVSECWRVCKPGGFVEFTEMDMRVYESTDNSKLIKWMNQQVVSAMKKGNLDPRLPRNLQDQFFKLLVDDQPCSSRGRQDSYQVKYTSLPLGVWGGRLGVLFRDDIHDVLDALDVAATVDKYGNALTEEEWQTTMNILDDELDSQKAFMNLYQIFAQKNKS